MAILVKNPHSILATLEVRPQDVIEIVIPPQLKTESWKLVEHKAKHLHIPITHATKAVPVKTMQRKDHPREDRNVERKKNLPQQAHRESTAHALIKDRPSVPIEELFSNVPKQKQDRGLWLALDTLQDPQNVGAIFRAAAFFGVQGIVMTEERSAPLTNTVYDIASGGVEYVPFAMQVNLQRAFEKAKDAGLWILGSSEHAKEDIKQVPLDRPWLLVLGNEEKGMRRLTEESCDALCKIPALGQVTSLNVSVAAGILISHLSS